MSVKFPFKTDAIQLGPNATSPTIFRTPDNNLVFFDQATGEIQLSDLAPKGVPYPKLFQSLQQTLNNTSSLLDLQETNSLHFLQQPNSPFDQSLDTNLPSLFFASPNSSWSSKASFSNGSPTLIFYNCSFSNGISLTAATNQKNNNAFFYNCSFNLPSLTDAKDIVYSQNYNLSFFNCSFQPKSNIKAHSFSNFSLSHCQGSPNLFLFGAQDTTPNFFCHATPINHLTLSYCSATLSNYSPISSSLELLNNSSLSYPLPYILKHPDSFTISAHPSSSFSPTSYKPAQPSILPKDSSSLKIPLPAPLPSTSFITLIEANSSTNSLASSIGSQHSVNGMTNTLTLNLSNLQTPTPFVSSKTTSSFTIATPNPSPLDLELNWILFP